MDFLCFSVLLLFLGGAVMLRAGDALTTSNRSAEYGSVSSGAITVTISGPAVRKPGIYHLKAGITFGDLIKEAEWLRISDGRFILSRSESGKKSSTTLGLSQRDFILLDGDSIYAEAVLKSNSITVAATVTDFRKIGDLPDKSELWASILKLDGPRELKLPSEVTAVYVRRATDKIPYGPYGYPLGTEFKFFKVLRREDNSYETVYFLDREPKYSTTLRPSF